MDRTNKILLAVVYVLAFTAVWLGALSIKTKTSASNGSGRIMDKMYFKFVDGQLQRIGSLPKKKDGYAYFVVDVKDGLPVNGRLAKDSEFDEVLGSKDKEEGKGKKVKPITSISPGKTSVEPPDED